MKYELKQVTLDGQPTWKLKCPGCGIWQPMDDDQFNGRVSVQCGCNCGFHKTVNFKEWLEKNEPSKLVGN